MRFNRVDEKINTRSRRHACSNSDTQALSPHDFLAGLGRHHFDGGALASLGGSLSGWTLTGDATDAAEAAAASDGGVAAMPAQTTPGALPSTIGTTSPCAVPSSSPLAASH